MSNPHTKWYTESAIRAAVEFGAVAGSPTAAAILVHLGLEPNLRRWYAVMAMVPCPSVDPESLKPTDNTDVERIAAEVLSRAFNEFAGASESAVERYPIEVTAIVWDGFDPDDVVSGPVDFTEVLWEAKP